MAFVSKRRPVITRFNQAQFGQKAQLICTRGCQLRSLSFDIA